MAARFLASVHRYGGSGTSVPRKLATIAAPGLLGMVLGVGLFGAPAGALHPKAIVDSGGGSCSDSWKAAVSGLWSTAADWSTGVVPTSTSNVCIKVAGTYKVTIDGSASANTVVVGGSAGKQTLIISGTPSFNSALSLTAATGSKIEKRGVIQLKAKNVAGSGYALIGGGGGVTIANSGTFQTKGGKDSPIYLRVNISNGSTAKTEINGITTEDGSGGATTLTNKGTFSVGAKGSLTLTNGSAFTQTAGTFTNHGIFTEQDGVFTQTAGTDSGNPVTILDSGTLTDVAESGTYTFDLLNADTLSGTIPSGQTVDIIGNPTYNSNTTLAGNLTNDGTLELDALTTAGSGDAYLSGPSFTVTNAGTFETEGGTVSPDYLRTNITDTSAGKTDIDGITNEDASGGATTLTNSGTFSVGSSGSLTLTNGSAFTQTAGTFTNGGVFTEQDGVFTQTAGTDSGNPVTILDSGTLTDVAESGTYTFDLLNADTLSGTIPSGQTVDIIGNPTYNSNTTLAGNLTNDGTLELDALTTPGSGDAYLSGPSFTVTNAGTFETEGGTVSPDYLRTNITNDSGATVAIDGITNEDASGGATTLTNKGTFSVGSSGSLTLTNGSAFTQTAGTFTNGGVFNEDNGTFTQTAGTDSGNPVSITTGTLTDAGESGTYTFDLFNACNLGGTIPSGQTVDIIGNPTYNSNATLGANLTNDGTLELDALTTAGSGYAILTGQTFTVTNAGTFETEGGTVSPDYLRTNITDTSTGTTKIDGITTDDASGGTTTLTNNGTLSVGDGDAITITNGSGVTETSTGTFEPTVDATANKAYGIVGGAESLAGILDPTTVGSPAVNSTYNVISGASSVVGTFSTVDGAYTVSYSTGTVTVKAT